MKMGIIAPVAEPDSVFEDEDSDFEPLTHEQALAVKAANPSASPWRVVMGQVLVGTLAAGLAWLLFGSLIGKSVAYGSLAVALPAVLFAWGLSRQRGVLNAGSVLASFFVWEMAKIALTVALLVIAPRLILNLNWLALLAGFVLTMKVYWVAMWLRPVRQD